MRTPASRLLVLLLILMPVSLAAGIFSGSADLSPGQIMATLFGQSGSPASDVVWQLRLPRVLSAFACGGLLALSGVLLQVLLRNPLADPYILGVSGGAAVGALAAMLLGLSLAWVNLAAGLGATGAIGLVLTLSFRRDAWSMHHLLLTGVVLSAGFGAVVSLLLALAPTAEVRGMLFWLMGDLAHAQAPGLAWAVLLAAGMGALWQAGSLNVLGLGELKAKSLGVRVGAVQAGILLLASTAAAVAVVEGGSIGFVGLIVPHLLRLTGMADHRWLVPLSILAGGSFLAFADTLARTAAAPQQLPVGVLTALIGVPMLLVLLSRRR